MVKITNGINEFVVSEGAYEGVFKPQGYTLVKDEHMASEVIEEPQTDPCDELEEKPVSQWSKLELKEYCDKHGISLEGVARTEDVRERVLKFQEQSLIEE